MKHVMVFTMLIFIPVMVFAETIYVPGNHGTIQAAIDASTDGDTVIVRPGTYVENVVFNGKAITLQSEQGPESTVIDGNRAGSVVAFRNGEGLDSVLDGFTIRNGCISGVYCGVVVSPKITGNIITDNYGEFGGGIVCWEHSSPNIAGNTIDGNIAYTSGGGIYCDDDSSPQISDNSITDNSAEVGGGIWSVSDASSSISTNTISGNSADFAGGGIYCYARSSPHISNNSISDNSARFGGGIYSSTNSAPLISGNVISDCTASDDGGGVFCRASSSPQIFNCTITENSAENGGGIYCALNSSPSICDSYITNCRASGDGGGIYCYFNSSPLVSGNSINSCIANLCGGGIYSGENSTPLISDNALTNNSGMSGGGIYCWNASPVILNNRVSLNISSSYAGGISVTGDSAHPPAMISGNRIFNNSCVTGGGGVHLAHTTTTVLNNVISGNRAMKSFGGGIVCTSDTDVLIANNTITGNIATLGGGGIGGALGARITLVNTILWGNSSPFGKEVSLVENSTINISYCNVEGGLGSVKVEAGSILNRGLGMMNADPLFVSGSDGEYYLDLDSPCVDGGDPAGLMIGGTTRIDQATDAGVIDMGYHYPGLARLVAGPGPGNDNYPMVRVFPLEIFADFDFQFDAFGSSQYGVNVCCGDVNGDLHDEILTGAGPGETNRPHVRGFTCSGSQLPGLSFFAYNTNQYGVNVAAGDLDADGTDEIITGAGPGPAFGPHVRGWNYDGSGLVTSMANVNYFAYGTTQWGVTVSAGDIDGDGFDEIVTGAGPGAKNGPHVRGWNVDGGQAQAMGSVSFLAYGTDKFGVNVTCGDVDGDGIDEIVTGPGPGVVFGPHVRGWNVDGGTVTSMANLNYLAWSPDEVRYGANVSSGADLNGNGRDEIVVGQGPDSEAGTWVKVYMYDGSQVIEWISLEAFDGMTHGAKVAAGHF